MLTTPPLAAAAASPVRSGPVRLILEAIAEYAQYHSITTAEAIAILATKPDFGANGEVGGVDVYETGSRLRTKWTNSDDCTWCTLETLVQCEDGGMPDWYDPEWFIPA